MGKECLLAKAMVEEMSLLITVLACLEITCKSIQRIYLNLQQFYFQVNECYQCWYF